jgi:hypothetical protein
MYNHPMPKSTGKKMGKLLSVRIEEDLFSIIEQMAEKDRRPVGSMVRYLLWMAVLDRGLRKAMNGTKDKKKSKP